MMNKIDIKSMYYDELEKQMKEMGQPSFRTKQIYTWLHVKLVENFDEMTNLSKELRDQMEEKFIIVNLDPIKAHKSQLDDTRKYLFKLWDGEVIEAVVMKYKHGNTLCISSQVGCKMGCKFCASTIGGLRRNLEASEMLDQVYKAEKLIEERISNIVVMGVGEPFDNYNNLIRFLKIVTDDKGLNISSRHITVSTCGLPKYIRKFAEEGMQVTLALSLHSASDEERRNLMPIANKHSIAETLDACKYYYEKTGRRLTFEHALINEVNDFPEDAKNLARILKGINCHVNLIPINPIKERAFEKANSVRMEKFQNILEKNRINVTIRREMGSDIQAACGQLRNSYID